MDDLLQLTIMYDMYSPLLTEKQRNIFELYYMNNLSFQEIAELSDVSKASVFDLINRTKNKIYDYEKKLKLYEKYQEEQKLLQDIADEIELINIDKLAGVKSKLNKLIAYVNE